MRAFHIKHTGSRLQVTIFSSVVARGAFRSQMAALA